MLAEGQEEGFFYFQTRLEGDKSGVHSGTRIVDQTHLKFSAR